MEIRVQSIKFNADQKLLDFIDKKIGKLTKFFDNIIKAEVVLSVEPDSKNNNKNVKVILAIPGDDLVVEKSSSTFEDCVNDCADVLKDQLVKVKEKRFGK
jgi:putative sigma-54 modulation protein